MKDTTFLVIAGVLGLAVGLSGFYLMQDGREKSYCQQVEEGIEENKSFKGIVSCKPPGQAELNGSNSTVDENTELKCICRKSLNGREQILEIRKSN